MGTQLAASPWGAVQIVQIVQIAIFARALDGQRLGYRNVGNGGSIGTGADPQCCDCTWPVTPACRASPRPHQAMRWHDAGAVARR
jgi:hypothetical protein